MTIFRKLRNPVTAGIAALLILVTGVGVANAMNNAATSGGNIDRSIHKAGRDVGITGTINGDVYCAGQNIDIFAEVHGDVICAGQNITINGAVHGNVRAAGQKITIGAVVDNNISIAGQDFTLQKNGKVGRDAVIATQTTTLNGAIGRDAKVWAGTLTINDSVGRDIDAQVGDRLVLSGTASVAGGINYTSSNTIEKDPAAKVLGAISYHQKALKNKGRNWMVMWRLYWFVAMAVLSIVLVALFPQLFRRWNKLASSKIGYVLLGGLVAMIVIPIVAIILFTTIVGAPLGILLLLLWFVSMLLSGPLAIYYVGAMIAKRSHPLLAVLIGSIVLGLLTMVPVIGWLLTILIYWFGTGALLLNLKQLYKKPNYSAN